MASERFRDRGEHIWGQTSPLSVTFRTSAIKIIFMINFDGISVAFENNSLWQFITKTTWFCRARWKAILNHKTGFTLIEAIWDWLRCLVRWGIWKCLQNLWEKALPGLKCHLYSHLRVSYHPIRCLSRPNGIETITAADLSAFEIVNMLLRSKILLTNQIKVSGKASLPSMALAVQSEFR